MSAVCANENCQKTFEPEYTNQKYCTFKCKRARVMRKNRGKKNVEKYTARKGDTKICEYCSGIIQRNPRTSDFHWENQKYHNACYKKRHLPK